MNSENLLIILIALLVLVVICLLVLVVFVLLRSGILNMEGRQKETDLAPYSVAEQFFCSEHPEEYAVATCAICEEPVCENCHKDWDGIHLCPEHFALYGQHTWLEIAEIKTTPKAPEKGHKLYHFKHKIWHEEKIPAYLVTHYKINVEGDFVESWVQLFAREEDADQLTTRYKVITS